MCQQKDEYPNFDGSFIHNSQRLKTIQMSDEQMNNLWYSHTVKYCSAIKRNNLVIPTTAQINIKSIMLEEAKHKRKMQAKLIYAERNQNSGCLIGWRELGKNPSELTINNPLQ